MNTELSPEINRACSKRHGKIANNNSSDFAENNIRLQCLELSNNMLQELIIAKQVKHGIGAKCTQISSKHLKSWMQHDNMKLYAKSSKFHIEHTQNGATVQHTHNIQV